jgi:hypothetical protein
VTLHATYFTAVWAIVIGGLVPGVLFLASYRPQAWARQLQLDTLGWVVGFLYFYLVALAGLIAGAHDPAPAVAVVGIGRVGCDIFLWNRFFLHRRLKREFDGAPPHRRVGDAG